jgi:hypothetical protein
MGTINSGSFPTLNRNEGPAVATNTGNSTSMWERLSGLFPSTTNGTSAISGESVIRCASVQNL